MGCYIVEFEQNGEDRAAYGEQLLKLSLIHISMCIRDRVSYQKPFPGEPLGKDHPELLYNMKHSHGHDMAIVNGIGRIGYMKGCLLYTSRCV